MAEFKMGFIGTGNMGSALARAAAKSGEHMLLANRTPEKAEALAAVLGAKVGTNLQAAAACEYIFLGVKPQMLPALLERTDRFVLVSMAAGVKTGTIRQALGFDCPVVRIMPNLPVASGTGVILLSPGSQVKEDELCELERLLQAAGLLMRMPEGQIDAGSAVSGCGPAYVYLFLDALANGGVGRTGARILTEASIDDMRTNRLTGASLIDFGATNKVGYGYGLGVRTLTDAASSRSPLGEFGWDGAAGAWLMADPDHHLAAFYAQHVMCCGRAFDEFHPAIRDLIYEGMDG